MKLNMNRSFDCKNEELPVVCRFGAISLERDLKDFTTYSSTFDGPYLAAFKTRIEIVQELIQPNSETVALKVITDRIYQTLDGLISPINYLEGYLKLAGRQVPVSSADFGLVQLRRRVRARDLEGVLKQLHTVGENIKKYKKELMAKGLTEPLIARFTEAVQLLTDDKDKSYSLVSNRAAIVQSNMGLLNDLKNQLTEICGIGKILYKQTDQAKLKDYTFTQMMKQVRRDVKAGAVKPENRN
ncbi:MAG: hypothetical protein AAB347_12865 [Bacteroidota bacterium]